ncbi:shikimate dehydrogenase [Pseudaminobacter sp. 19-2017]|uniref:Shikimate dehydrogenase n=1 Tax=Pseudaminobacter soli (ex Zhang et al. 2022) TaxID=2831468 RepID=A0A942DZB9_9HYPH|nr:shikimate dehydrogenase [Pseudaminobacter soli]MBS3650994.1 shikimate dehydrogenase [Pseudaminobacter soli]
MPLPLSGKSRVYAILGDPIAQAGSPGLFNRAFRREGIGAVLVPIQVSADGLDAILAAFRAARNMDGLVVTVPHKIAIADRLDEIGPMAARIGAVNAIRKLPDGRLLGENFDGAGFVHGLRRRGHSLREKNVLVIGAGGAGRAVAHAVLDERPCTLGIYDIDRGRISQLSDDLQRHASNTLVSHAEPDAYGFDVIVNCTSLGMRDGDPLPLRLDGLDQRALVVDIVLEPSTTPLLHQAAARGCPTHEGIHMLDGQVEEICRFFGLLDERHDD